MLKTMLAVPVLLFALGFSGDAPGQGRRPPPDRGIALPFRSWTKTQLFKANQRACFVAIGSGLTYLGLYVYDEEGNCVAADDQANFATRDDIAVVWFPPKTARYTIEVYNFGKRRNEFEYSIRP